MRRARSNIRLFSGFRGIVLKTLLPKYTLSWFPIYQMGAGFLRVVYNAHIIKSAFGTSHFCTGSWVSVSSFGLDPHNSVRSIETERSTAPL